MTHCLQSIESIIVWIVYFVNHFKDNEKFVTTESLMNWILWWKVQSFDSVITWCQSQNSSIFSSKSLKFKDFLSFTFELKNVLNSLLCIDWHLYGKGKNVFNIFVLWLKCFNICVFELKNWCESLTETNRDWNYCSKPIKFTLKAVKCVLFWVFLWKTSSSTN